MMIRNGIMALCLALACGACSTTTTVRLYPGEAKSAEAVGRLVVPSAVEVLSVDGRKLRVSMAELVNKTWVYELLPGTHKVEARYSVMVDIDDDSYSAFQSLPETLIIEVKEGTTYTLLHETQNERVVGSSVEMDVSFRIVETDTPTEEADVDTGRVLEWAEVEKPAVEPREPLKELKASWKRATQEDRAEFMQWIVTDQ